MWTYPIGVMLEQIDLYRTQVLMKSEKTDPVSAVAGKPLKNTA